MNPSLHPTNNVLIFYWSQFKRQSQSCRHLVLGVIAIPAMMQLVEMVGFDISYLRMAGLISEFQMMSNRTPIMSVGLQIT